ncbi:MAG: hypothetical protein KBC81_01195 [Candidatus Pacebacteria bacterium]|nr:hypothetical protein [Candidatus Paceibacterota bacterium]
MAEVLELVFAMIGLGTVLWLASAFFVGVGQGARYRFRDRIREFQIRFERPIRFALRRGRRIILPRPEDTYLYKKEKR